MNTIAYLLGQTCCWNDITIRNTLLSRTSIKDNNHEKKTNEKKLSNIVAEILMSISR